MSYSPQGDVKMKALFHIISITLTIISVFLKTLLLTLKYQSTHVVQCRCPLQGLCII